MKDLYVVEGQEVIAKLTIYFTLPFITTEPSISLITYSKGPLPRLILFEEESEAMSTYSPLPDQPVNLRKLFESFQLMKNAIDFVTYQVASYKEYNSYIYREIFRDLLELLLHCIL